MRTSSGTFYNISDKDYGGTYIGGMPAIYLKGIREGYAWTGDEEILGNIYDNPELLEDDE